MKFNSLLLGIAAFLTCWCINIHSLTPADTTNMMTIPLNNEVQYVASTTVHSTVEKPLKLKKSKRKRVKAKMHKWLSVFSKLDQNNKRVLTYYGMMLAGAIARSASATAVHPLNVIKTRLQTKEGKMPELSWKSLSRGAGSQFIMSIPHGALNYAVTETTKLELARLAIELDLSSVIPKHLLDPILDFFSSAISTFICSVVSTPQMVLTDKIMAGRYDNFVSAIVNIAKNEGFLGFYRGWLPALVQKIPSYALTWMFFQQVKLAFYFLMNRPGTTLENTFLGSFAAAGACCVMIPVDTVKTRMVMQQVGDKTYEGMLDCFSKIIKNEGVYALYKALPPRLCAVVPMIGIQFSVYELIKRLLLQQPAPKTIIQSSATTKSNVIAEIPQNNTIFSTSIQVQPQSQAQKQQNVSTPKEDTKHTISLNVYDSTDAAPTDLSEFDVLNPTITATDFESVVDENVLIAEEEPSEYCKESDGSEDSGEDEMTDEDCNKEDNNKEEVIDTGKSSELK